jgi:hypothetical protein
LVHVRAAVIDTRSAGAPHAPEKVTTGEKNGYPTVTRNTLDELDVTGVHRYIDCNS